MIPPFLPWAPVALLGAAVAFIAVRSRRASRRKPRSWLRDFESEARERDRRQP